jgi:RNA polymerase sigma-70 factor, ECF subfamily
LSLEFLSKEEFVPGMENENSALLRQHLSLFATEERKGAACRSRVVELFSELRLPLYSYLVCIGLTPPESEDVIQESFLLLHQQLNRGTKISDFRSWLFRVAHNLTVNLQRSSRRFLYSEEEESVARIQEEPGKGPTPEDSYLQKELDQRLDHCMQRLTEQQRQCLQLRVEGLKYREIASVMGISISSVSELMERAIVRLTGALHD